MQFTCPECNKQLKLDDGLAGKKIKCPGCSKVVAVEEDVPEVGVVEARPKPAANGVKPASARKRADDDDDDENDDREEAPKKKSKTGLLIGIGCGLLALMFLVLAGGGGAAWWLFLREKPATVENAGGGGGDGDGKNKGGQGDGDNKGGGDGDNNNVMLGDAKIDILCEVKRFSSPERVEFHINYNVVKGVTPNQQFVFVALLPGKTLELGSKTGKELLDNPKGKMPPNQVSLEGPNPIGDAVQCSVEVRFVADPAKRLEGPPVGFHDGVQIPKATKTGEPAKFTLNVLKAERMMPSGGIKLQIEYKVTGDVQEKNIYTCYGHFPSLPKPIVLGTIRGDQLKAQPTGQWGGDYNPGPAIAGDGYVDVVLRTGINPKSTLNGPELVRLKVDLPGAAKPPPTITAKIDEKTLVAKRIDANRVEFTFDLEATGTIPAFKAVDVVAEIINPKDGKKTKYLIKKLAGGDFKSGRYTGTILMDPGLDDVQICTVFVDSALSAASVGDLGRFENIKIMAREVVPISVQLTGPRVERISADGTEVNVKVNYFFSRKPDADKLYPFFIRYRDKGDPATVLTLKVGEERGDLLGTKGLFLKQKIKLPAAALDDIEMVMGQGVTLPDDAKPDPPLAVSNKFKIAAYLDPKAKSGAANFASVSVFKVDNDRVKVVVAYEFTSPPDANKVYTLLLHRNDTKEDVIVRQAVGKEWIPKDEIEQIVGKPGIGTTKNFKVWMAESPNPPDDVAKDKKISPVLSAALKAEEKMAIEISNVKVVRKGGKTKGIEIDFDYVFKEGAPNPKATYSIFMRLEGGKAPKDGFEIFKTAKAGQMQASQTGAKIFNGYNLTTETEIEIWIVENAPGMPARIMSNKAKADFKKLDK
jgi:hypothetical protein